MSWWTEDYPPEYEDFTCDPPPSQPSLFRRLIRRLTARSNMAGTVTDPDRMLEDLRQAAKQAVKGEDDRAAQLAVQFLELDKWMTRRGFPPKEWSAWHSVHNPPGAQ